MTTAITDQATFYREFLMGRKSFVPQDYGVEMDRDAFDDLIVDEFGAVYKGRWTIDELLLHPSEALRFCGDVKHKYHFYDVPDDIILRTILARRKKPNE